MSRFKTWINETKYISGLMIGYKIPFTQISRLSNNIKTWLDHYNIKYEQKTNIHITIASVPGKYNKSLVTRKIQELPGNFTLTPKRLKLMWGYYVGKWYIAIEYAKHNKYKEAREKLKEQFPDVVIIKDKDGERIPFMAHASLFSMDTNKETALYLFNEVSQRYTKQLPKIKLGELQLYNKNQIPIFDYKVKKK